MGDAAVMTRSNPHTHSRIQLGLCAMALAPTAATSARNETAAAFAHLAFALPLPVRVLHHQRRLDQLPKLHSADLVIGHIPLRIVDCSSIIVSMRRVICDHHRGAEGIESAESRGHVLCVQCSMDCALACLLSSPVQSDLESPGATCWQR